MQIKDVLIKTTQFFRDKGFGSPRLDAEILLATALNWERVKLYLNYEYPMNEAELGAARDLVRRRAAGEPIAYILGHRDFYKASFKVSPAVLIPRPETEAIVEDAVAYLRALNTEGPHRVIDLGTGSGCIGLSIAQEVESVKFLGVEVSEDAALVARENAESLSLNERVEILVSDVAQLCAEEVLSRLGGKVDVVVANPPYIDINDPMVEAGVKRFEPNSALFSAENGLAHIRAWAERALDFARPGAFTMFEIGHEQGPSALEIFENTGGYTGLQIIKDLSGKDRFIRGQRAGDS